MPELRVGGLTPFTSTDFPGRLAAVVYVQGCPWRCGYCHNPHLQTRNAGAMAWAEVLAWARRRAGLLDAIVFSGGEPTLDPALPAAAAQVRALGFQVGLHTAGLAPRRFAELLPLLDWVGLDVKAPLSHAPLHDRITGARHGTRGVRETLQRLLGSGLAFECRTTARPEDLGDDELLQLADELANAGVRHYALQLAHTGTPGAHGFDMAAYPAPATLARIAGRFERFTLRGGASAASGG